MVGRIAERFADRRYLLERVQEQQPGIRPGGPAHPLSERTPAQPRQKRHQSLEIGPRAPIVFQGEFDLMCPALILTRCTDHRQTGRGIERETGEGEQR